MAITTVAIAPTETVVVALGVTYWGTATRVSIQVVNLNGSQLFVGVVYRRKYGMSAWAQAPNADFESIPAGESRMMDLDSFGTDELEVRGYMSGAGGNVQVGDSKRTGQRP